ncbi:MAG: hypothetical protein UW92_C0034G0011 [Candidatus Jorgensenbacteria bacterium GW2011_GWA2_45_13]|uniref:TraC-like domain-containing protein n=1 Tax=Candidatus Jorgensenbacteria bacterium GW2011_GWA2_45_13 TaxID=1618662 RepID=A0A0G1P2H9_9BACT|nr:MAG: hypothetical protein UW92_C0034G0011 [Candidatus Jorgensenbacteria bacterium GW2011_GWA2_45_13]
MPEKNASTQQFVSIQKIKDGVVYLKKGGLRRVVIVGGINFDLKSEAEQNLILSTFQNFINTLDFSVQFFIHSRKVNVERYLEKMAEHKEKEESELLKIQIEEYANFIRTFVEQNNIVSKTFFVVVPYDISATVEQAKGIFSFLNKDKGDGSSVEQGHLQQLTQRVDEVIDGLSQIGLRGVALEDEELTELFYNLYNPEFTEKKELKIAKE